MAVRFAFNERKAAEAAAHLLRMSGGQMPYISLIKLMYFADRRTLIETGFPITGDSMVSMPHGPVLSRVLDQINQGQPSGAWRRLISEPDGYDVHLRAEPPVDGALSNYEISVLRSVHARYGHMDRWAIVDASHKLPEYTDPHGSAMPISPKEVLRLAGKSDAEVAFFVAEAESVWSIDEMRAVEA